MNAMTYEELIDFISVDETVVICLDFEQRRAAIQSLCEMGFICGADTMEYVEQSEANKDMQFMNPGLLCGKITCFNSKYVDRHRCVEFDTFMNIFNCPHQLEQTESEEDFEIRLKSLLCS